MTSKSRFTSSPGSVAVGSSSTSSVAPFSQPTRARAIATAVRCAGGKVVDGSLDVDVAQPQPGQRLAGAAHLLTPADAAADASLVAGSERDVLDGAHRPDEPEVLMNEPNARRGGGSAVTEGQRLTVDPRLRTVGVGLVIPGEHLDQRRLARTVLADERVNLAGLDRQRDVRRARPAPETSSTNFRCAASRSRNPPNLRPKILAN